MTFLNFQGGENLKTSQKYNLYISYTLFGAVTAAIDILIYTLCVRVFRMNVVCSNSSSWLLSTTAAYITNRKWVFKSENHVPKSLIREMISFFGCRAITLFLGTLIIAVGVHNFGHDEIVMKFVSAVFVVIVNYIASKLIIFRTRT